jgi:putative NADPH-quinone reductase
MNILMVIAHPNTESFNHAIAATAVAALQDNGHTVIYRDLHEEEFDPILVTSEFRKSALLQPSLEEHCADLSAADGIVIVHPNWWGMPPAILTGWVDRVLRPDVAYRFLEGDNGEGVPVGLLQAKTTLVFNTANTPALREQQVFGDPLETIWRNCILGLCGVARVYRRTFTVVVTSSPQKRAEWLAEVKRTVLEHFPTG